MNHKRMHLSTDDTTLTFSSVLQIFIRLLSRTKGSFFLLGFTLLTTIAGTVMKVLTPSLLGKATTLLHTGAISATGIDFSRLLKLLLLSGVLSLGSFLSVVLQKRIMTVLAQKTGDTLRTEIKEKISRLPISTIDATPKGEILSLATNDMEGIMSNLQEGLGSIVNNVVLLIGTFIFMLTISWKLTIVVAVMIPGSVLLSKTLTPRLQKNYSLYMEETAKLNSQIEENYQGFAVIKSFQQEKSRLESMDSTNKNLYEYGWRSRFFGSMTMGGMLLIENLVYVIVAVFSGLSVMSGSLQIGEMQAFFQYVQEFSSATGHIPHTWVSLLSAIVSMNRVLVLLEQEEVPKPISGSKPVKDNAKIVFENVDFGYDNQLLFRGLNLTVTQGETIAIVGETGAGKTTLMNLLVRFYDSSSGEIRIDGENIKAMSYDALREKLAMVLQDTWLFSGTIYENIALGNSNATMEDVIQAAKSAHAHSFITQLPNGYNTLLGEDSEILSAGQRQLITIARAFATDPEILILDEATSNVDSRTELIVQKAMENLMQNRTSFVIAHRLSTVYGADRILVMDKGKLVGCGSHKKLLETNETYASIYNSQFTQVPA